MPAAYVNRQYPDQFVYRHRQIWTIRDILPESDPKSTITKTRLFKYKENFTSKNWKFWDKKTLFFHISAQNINCG